jgi:hypothetical protein
MRGFLVRPFKREDGTVGDSRQLEARARFWSELREGQRAAEATIARRDP